LTTRCFCAQLGTIVAGRCASVRRVLRKGSDAVSGYLITWDVDSRSGSQCAKVRRFVFGYSTHAHGRTYRHPGFVEKEGVTYVGQSTLCVTADRLAELRSFLDSVGARHVIRPGWAGAILGT
jgi:hypothetical protein